ncbi:hypothetical protein JK358_07695 [Nocardia sp. 2]|uniref:Uncharacterized protein n=1 Tax=Nocardia acididurans TaxID=2802282 RepID=A0ABS1M0S6_9NOCA|nr:hypothetical protein [Nocardia acididurans]MBL1074278.1 hypothetical protein [Nocardia acididurans]
MHGNSGHVLTVAEIDRELGDRQREIDAIAATLVEVDKHPGLQLLRRYAPTGVTAQRWTSVQESLDLLWEEFGRLRTILDRARAARTRWRLDALDREELTALLRGRPLEVSRTTIPLAQRSLTGPREQVVHVGLADTVERMKAVFPGVTELLDAVEAVNSRVMSALAPLQTEIERAGPTHPELRPLAEDIAALTTQAAIDPLSLTPAEIDRRAGELSTRMAAAATLLAELAAMAADWGGATAQLRQRVETLRKTYERALHARTEVERTILAGALPDRPDDSAVFSAEVTALEANPPAPAALWELRRRLDAAQSAAARSEELAQGLLDRRGELSGRLSAYRAKAARLGVAEDRDVLAAGRIAAGLLARKPCDLAAVTRAVTDYRQLIAQKSGRRP